MRDVVDWSSPPAPHPSSSPPGGPNNPYLVPLYEPPLYAGHPYLYPYYAAAVQAAYAASTAASMKCLGDADRSVAANERWVYLSKDTFQEIFDNTLHCEMKAPLRRPATSRAIIGAGTKCADLEQGGGGGGGGAGALADITNDEAPRGESVEPLDLSTRPRTAHPPPPERCEHCLTVAASGATCEPPLAAGRPVSSTSAGAPGDPGRALLPRGVAVHKAEPGRVTASSSMRLGERTHRGLAHSHGGGGGGGKLNDQLYPSPVAVVMRKGGTTGGGRAENWAPLSKSKVYDLIDEVVSQMDATENRWPGRRPAGLGQHDAARSRATPPRSPAEAVKRPRIHASQNNNNNNNNINNNTYSYGSVMMKPASSDQSLSPRCASQRGEDLSQDAAYHRDVGPSNRAVKQCWVALNKMVVFDIVDSAIRNNQTYDGGPEAEGELEDDGAEAAAHPGQTGGDRQADVGQQEPVEGAQLARGKNSLSLQVDERKKDADAGRPGPPASRTGSRQGSPVDGRQRGSPVPKDGSPVRMDEDAPALKVVNSSYRIVDIHANLVRRKRAHSVTPELEVGSLSKRYKDTSGVPSKTSTPPPNLQDLTHRPVYGSNAINATVIGRERKLQPPPSGGQQQQQQYGPSLKPSPSAPVDLASWRGPSSPVLVGGRRGRGSPTPPPSPGGASYGVPAALARDVLLRVANPAHLGVGQRRPIDRLANENFVIKDIKGVHVPTPVIRSPSSMSENNQCAPADTRESANMTGKAALASREVTAPPTGLDLTHGVLTASAGTDDSRDSSRSSPRLGWIAVSKADVHTIVDSVVERMMLDDAGATERRSGDDRRSPSGGGDHGGDNNDHPVPSSRSSNESGQRADIDHSNTPSPSSVGRASPEAIRQLAPLTIAEERPDSPCSDRSAASPDHGLASPNADVRRKSGPFKWKSTLLDRVHEESKSGAIPPSGGSGGGRISSGSRPTALDSASAYGEPSSSVPYQVPQQKSQSQAEHSSARQTGSGLFNCQAKVK